MIASYSHDPAIDLTAGGRDVRPMGAVVSAPLDLTSAQSEFHVTADSRSGSR